MLILRNFLITILLLMLAAISVVGIMVEFPQIMQWTPDRINELGRSVVRVMRPGMLLFFVWWFILIASLLVFFLTVGRSRRRMKIEVQMGGGRVVIMDAAIKKYIRSALSEIDDVHVKKIELREHRNQVTTDIYADVRTKDSLPVLERRIITRVRTALAEDLGITNLGDVHVFIKNFEVTGRPITPAPAPADQPEDSNLSPESQFNTGEIEDETAVRPEPHDAETTSLVTPADSLEHEAPTPSADIEPVIGGESATDAEHHIDTNRSPMDQAEQSIALSDTEIPGDTERLTPADDEISLVESRDDAPVVTETSAAEPIDFDINAALAQDPDAPPADSDIADHKDLDDHDLPWERKIRDGENDDSPGGNRNL